jgi:hypothetical protein
MEVWLLISKGEVHDVVYPEFVCLIRWPPFLQGYYEKIAG